MIFKAMGGVERRKTSDVYSTPPLTQLMGLHIVCICIYASLHSLITTRLLDQPFVTQHSLILRLTCKFFLTSFSSSLLEIPPCTAPFDSPYERPWRNPDILTALSTLFSVARNFLIRSPIKAIVIANSVFEITTQFTI